jgi:hypothetical protein
MESKVMTTLTDGEIRVRLLTALGHPPRNWDWSFTAPDYTVDLNAMAQVEAVIAERGLAKEYVFEIALQTRTDVTGWETNWQMITTQARTRALAALAVLEQTESPLT